jgi:hypothetical protein
MTTAVYLLLKLDPATIPADMAADGAAKRCKVRLGEHVIDAQPVLCGLGEPGRFDVFAINLDPEQTRVYGHEGIPMRIYAILRPSLKALT